MRLGECQHFRLRNGIWHCHVPEVLLQVGTLVEHDILVDTLVELLGILVARFDLGYTSVVAGSAAVDLDILGIAIHTYTGRSVGKSSLRVCSAVHSLDFGRKKEELEGRAVLKSSLVLVVGLAPARRGWQPQFLTLAGLPHIENLICRMTL